MKLVNPDMLPKAAAGGCVCVFCVGGCARLLLRWKSGERRWLWGGGTPQKQEGRCTMRPSISRTNDSEMTNENGAVQKRFSGTAQSLGNIGSSPCRGHRYAREEPRALRRQPPKSTVRTTVARTVAKVGGVFDCLSRALPPPLTNPSRLERSAPRGLRTAWWTTSPSRTSSASAATPWPRCRSSCPTAAWRWRPVATKRRSKPALPVWSAQSQSQKEPDALLHLRYLPFLANFTFRLWVPVIPSRSPRGRAEAEPTTPRMKRSSARSRMTPMCAKT
eukprot:scaffold470_cov257-Pinguiococcus_pyrenoidosus.AAC.1